MPKWVEELFFRADPGSYWVLVLGLAPVVVVEWVFTFRKLVRGRGCSGTGLLPVMALICSMLLLTAKRPLIIDVEAHPLILMLLKAIEGAAFFFGVVFLAYYTPLWAFSLLKRLGIVSPPDRERNGSDE